MSIWCSWPQIGWTQDGWVTAAGKPIKPKKQGGEVRSYASGWSNHYPTTDDAVERRASIDLADIAPWCVPGHEQSAEGPRYWDHVGPWLRITVDHPEHNWHKPAEIIGSVHAGVVLDEKAVTALRDALNEWLDKPKVRPRKPKKPRTGGTPT